MSEEEKKAIEYLKDLRFEKQAFSISKDDFEEVKQIETILNLIEKQEKEIERLKEFEKYYETEKVVWSRNDYISKDKIKAKIKELEQYKKEELKNDSPFGIHSEQWAIADYVIDILKELLGE